MDPLSLEKEIKWFDELCPSLQTEGRLAWDVLRKILMETEQKSLTKAVCIGALKDLKSFCNNRMDSTKGDMRAAYRDVLFLVRQHLKSVTTIENCAPPSCTGCSYSFFPSDRCDGCTRQESFLRPRTDLFFNGTF